MCYLHDGILAAIEEVVILGCVIAWMRLTLWYVKSARHRLANTVCSHLYVDSKEVDLIE